MSSKAIQKMSKRELRDACNHQHAALQSLLAAVAVVKPALDARTEIPAEAKLQADIALLEASEESARRALDAYL